MGSSSMENPAETVLSWFWVWRKQHLYKLISLLQIGLVIALISGVLGVYIPIVIEEVKYQARMTVKNFQAVFPRGMLASTGQSQAIPAWAGTYGIAIPNLGIQEVVIERVDAGNKQVYMEALLKGVAHAAGSSLPGKAGVGYYFAHSSGLPFWGGRAATFATLHRLEQGDEIVVYREGQTYRYHVIEKKVVNPDNLELLMTTGGVERVVLQTCWPLGTDWQRMLVVAERV